ncbi:MAG: PEP/pyruvate-binding domain-containing protein [Xanthomonadales bacterium]
MRSSEPGRQNVPWFDRNFFRSAEPITRIGYGRLGGKASGLVRIRELLQREFDADRFPGVEVYVPKMVVIATDVYDAFMERNGLVETALSACADHPLAEAFQRAELPVEILGDLHALAEEAHTPLAVRSSSLLEDALQRPFAGVYGTKMLPNNSPDADTRFRHLVEAIKYVFASTWFQSAKSYIRATDRASTDEKMAVIVQEVVGRRHDERFYPDLSGVGRSYNFFPAADAKPADGVVNLALGLGKTIVDGGVSWIYTPTRPRAPMPFNSVDDILKLTQLSFWAVNMGRPPAYDPIAETEYLVQADLAAAHYDDTLAAVASTYDANRGRFLPGTARPGPRVVDFAPLLGAAQTPFNEVVRELLALGERALGDAVEIEFAGDLPDRGRGTVRLGFLQLRPMLVSQHEVDIADADLASPDLLLATGRAIGNGAFDSISDIVYVRPESFEARLTPTIASELDRVNRTLVEEQRPYLLLGFGRWGSSDPWLGIPVEWGQIAGARVIVESTLPEMNVELSQGAHFFHNLLSFDVPYLSVAHDPNAAGYIRDIDWAWLDRQAALNETALVRHVRLPHPLFIAVDGRSGRGAVWREPPTREDRSA